MPEISVTNTHSQVVSHAGIVDCRADGTLVCCNCGSAKLQWANLISHPRNNDEVRCEICGGNTITIQSALIAEQLRENQK